MAALRRYALRDGFRAGLAMSDNENRTLSGHWSGLFTYPGGLGEPTPFNVVLVESGGALSGECVEPNTFSPDPIHELFASLAGERNGLAVSFVKTYERAAQAGHQVQYDGVADARLTRIDGDWRFGGWSGGFVMTRLQEGEAESETVEAEAEA